MRYLQAVGLAFLAFLTLPDFGRVSEGHTGALIFLALSSFFGGWAVWKLIGPASETE